MENNIQKKDSIETKIATTFFLALFSVGIIVFLTLIVFIIFLPIWKLIS